MKDEFREWPADGGTSGERGGEFNCLIFSETLPLLELLSGTLLVVIESAGELFAASDVFSDVAGVVTSGP